MERIVEDQAKNKKKEQKSKGGNADWSAFISDIKALSELLILLVAAMRYLSCPPVRRMPLSNPTCPLTFSSCQCRCRWPRSCMRQLYGPCAVLCDASLAPDLMAKSGSSLKRGPKSKGRAYELGAEEPGLVIQLPKTQGFGHSGAALVPLRAADRFAANRSAASCNRAQPSASAFGVEIGAQRWIPTGDPWG